jgi:phage terminase large subunit GpA-like protein
MLLKGQETLRMPVGIPKAVDINWQGRRIDRGVKLWPVGVDLLKTELYGRLRLEKPTESEEIPFGWCNFPPYDEEYFKQLTAEQKVGKLVKGFRQFHWEKTRERNEALDCRVYNRAAAVNLLIEQYQEADWLALEAKLPANDNHLPAAEPVPQKQRRKGGWLDR